MDAKTLAEQLNGMEYPFQLPPELRAQVKEAGLVVLYGASDDLYEVEGAFCHEGDAREGTKILIHPEGILGSRDDIDTDEDMQTWLNQKAASRAFTAHWCKNNTSWSYSTDVTHETFKIMEDDEVYCIGIVFHLDALKQYPEKQKDADA